MCQAASARRPCAPCSVLVVSRGNWTRTKRHLLGCFCAITLLAFAHASASAAPIVSWDFANPSIEASPTEALTVFATVSNDASATDPISFSTLTALGGMGAPPGGGSPLTEAYQVELADIIFLRPVRLDPGDSITLPWADLSPLGGSAPPGLYGPGEAGIELESLFVASSGLFTVTVVPEAGTGLLCVLGLLAWACARGRSSTRTSRVTAT